MKDTKAGNDEVEEFVWVLEVLKSVLGGPIKFDPDSFHFHIDPILIPD